MSRQSRIARSGSLAGARQRAAAVKLPQFHERYIGECIALATAQGSHATLDEDFAEDLEAIIDSHREPLRSHTWD